MGENSTGSLFIDLFENIVSVSGSTLGRNVLLVMTVMGYVSLCEKLDATKMFAVYAAKPIKKIKSPYMIAVFVIILGIFLKLAITSSSSLCTMLIATMYPIMRAAGCSRGTAATAVTLPGCVIWGRFLLYQVESLRSANRCHRCSTRIRLPQSMGLPSMITVEPTPQSIPVTSATRWLAPSRPSTGASAPPMRIQ